MQGQTKGSIHTCLNYSSYTHILDLFDLELFTKTTPNFFEICEKSCFLLQSFCSKRTLRHMTAHRYPSIAVTRSYFRCLPVLNNVVV